MLSASSFEADVTAKIKTEDSAAEDSTQKIAFIHDSLIISLTLW